jgi:hypothetical protein
MASRAEFRDGDHRAYFLNSTLKLRARVGWYSAENNPHESLNDAKQALGRGPHGSSAARISDSSTLYAWTVVVLSDEKARRENRKRVRAGVTEADINSQHRANREIWLVAEAPIVSPRDGSLRRH